MAACGRDQYAGVRGQESGVSSQGSVRRSQESGIGVHSVYSVYSVVHINHELHIRGSSDAQRADTKLWSFIVHQPFKQHNRLQSAAQVCSSSYPHPMRKNLSTLHSLLPFYFCLDDFHATLPNSQSHWPMIFRPPRITSPQFSSSILFILFRHHHSLPSNSNHFAHILPPPACGTNIQNIRRLGDIE